MNNSQPTVVGGRYELGELLGRGGMAEVRKGTDTRLGRVVAVKRLRTDLASDATFQARFRREAQSSASLNHPTIVAVYDTGEEPSTDGTGVAQPYIVMEYVAGRTLRDILREGRKILPERALEITSGVLSALDYSHRAGIIHRDIKPGNVMLTPSGDVKVMDFGIARAISDAQSTMTQTAAVVGTAQYLSPEQARGETVDSRSDVYSAGCLLYELLTGRPPFVGDSPVAVAYQHVREPVTPPSDHDTALPPEVDAIVMKALTKRLEDRYQSAAAMRSDIERYLAGRPVEAAVAAPVPETAVTAVVPSVPHAVPPTPVTPRPLPEEEEYDEPPRSRAALWVLLVLLVVGLVLAAYFLWPRLFEAPPEQTQVPDTIGMKEAEARDAIGDAGLAVGEVTSRPDDNVQGRQGARAGAGRRRVRRPRHRDRPDHLRGQARGGGAGRGGRAARRRRGHAPQRRLRRAVEKEESDEDVGKVLRTEPAAGVLAADGVDGDDLLLRRQGEGARRRRRCSRPRPSGRSPTRGSRPSVVEFNNTTEPAGTVIQQSPEAGQTPPEGSTITIVVSTYVEPTDLPTDPTEPADRSETTVPAARASGRAG